MAKKMDPNVKITNAISNALFAVTRASNSDPAGLVISKGGRSALQRIKSLADAIAVPTDADVERIAHERKLALAAFALKAKAKADREKAKAKRAKNTAAAAKRSGKRGKAKAAKRSKAKTSDANATH